MRVFLSPQAAHFINMSTYIDIPTHKHIPHLVVNSIWFCICLFVTGLGIYGCIMKFQWNYLLVLAASIVGLLYYGDALWTHFTYPKLIIRVEAKENTVIFSGVNEKGEKLTDLYDDISFDMNKVVRAYYRLTRAKVLKFKSIDFQLNNTLKSCEEIYFLSDALDVTEEDIYEVLHFLKKHYPHIELGLAEA